MKISYIIITWNGIELLKQLLLSMSNQLLRDDIEVILTDNGSTDGTREFIAKHYPQIKYIYLPQNKGVAYARNRAMEQAKGEYLFILDNDIVLNDNAANRIEQYMDHNPQVGLCACQLRYSDGAVQDSAKRFPSLKYKIHNVLSRKKNTLSYPFQINQNQPFEPVYVIGACQMVRAAALKQVGLLDENIFYGPEDADFCIRFSNLGWKVIYLPDVFLVHHCQRKTTSKPFSSLGRKHIKALMYFYKKYKRLY